MSIEFKVGDIVRANSRHVNPDRKYDKGFVAALNGKEIWVVWFGFKYEVHLSFKDELVLIWRDENKYLEGVEKHNG